MTIWILVGYLNIYFFILRIFSSRRFHHIHNQHINSIFIKLCWKRKFFRNRYIRIMNRIWYLKKIIRHSPVISKDAVNLTRSDINCTFIWHIVGNHEIIRLERNACIWVSFDSRCTCNIPWIKFYFTLRASIYILRISNSI